MNTEYKIKINVFNWITPYKKDIVLKNNKSLSNHIKFEIKRNGGDFLTIFEELMVYNGQETKFTCNTCGRLKVLVGSAYGFICKNQSCIQMIQDNAKLASKEHLKKYRKFGNIEFENYILSNLNFYIENLHEYNVYDPYFGKYTKNVSLKRFITENVVHKVDTEHPWVNHVTCKLCNTPFKNYILKPRDICKSKSCVSHYSRYGLTKPLIKNIDYIKLIDKFICVSSDNLNNYQEILDFIRLNKITSKIFKKFYIANKDHDIFIINSIFGILRYLDNGINFKVHQFENMFFACVFNKSQQVMLKNIDYSKYGISDIELKINLHEFFDSCCVCCSIYQKNNFDGTFISRFCSRSCYNKSLSIDMRDKIHPGIFNTPDIRATHSNFMKNLILCGKFTPNITNSWCKSRTAVNINGTINYCRSSWDATFSIANPDCLYEDIRIPYYIDGIRKIYIVDFVNHNTRQLFEIKPDSNTYSEIYYIKFLAAENWCILNGYTYNIIGDSWFHEYFNNSEYSIAFEHQPEKNLILKRMSQFIKKK